MFDLCLQVLILSDMNGDRIGRFEVCVVATLLSLSMISQSVAAATSATPCPIPLKKGTQWVYEGTVKWTVLNSAKVKSARIRWVTEVVESVVGTNGLAGVVRGFPDELAWYEPGQSPSYCVFLHSGNKVYRLQADGENHAKTLAQQVSGNPEAIFENAEEFLELPLVVGRKWGQDPVREDSWYCWCVERLRAKAELTKGVDPVHPLKVFRLAYRTCPSHQILDIAPGLGVVHYLFDHHGTVASANMRLVRFSQL